MLPRLIVALLAAASGTPGESPVVGMPQEAQLAPGSSHVYGLELQVGEFVRLEVDRRDIGLNTTWTGPDGEAIMRLEGSRENPRADRR